VRYAGPGFLPSLAVAVVGGAVLFLSSVTWLEVTGASVLLVGAALIVRAIATPEFLEKDQGAQRRTPR
jgi:hypothetical protein